jgi:hypothetical protein
MITRLQFALRPLASCTQLAAATAIALFYFAASAQATPIFSDDFESLDVDATDYDGDGYPNGAIDTNKWVKATGGFGSTRQGTVD